MDFAQMRDQLAEEVLNPLAVPIPKKPVSAKKVEKEMEAPMKPAQEVSKKVNPLNTDSNRPQDREHRRNPNVYGDRPVTAFDSGNMKYSLWDYMKPEKVSTENFPEGGNPEIDTESYIAGLIGMVGTGVLGGILGGPAGVVLGGMAGKYLTEPAVHYLTQDQANENVPVSAKQKTQPKTQTKTESSEVKYTNRDRFGNESAGSGKTGSNRGRVKSNRNSSNSNTDRDRQSQENPNVRATNNPSSLPSDHAGRPR